MRNFLRVASGVDMMPLLMALQTNPDLWDQNKLRTMYPQSPHHQVSDIWLRFGDMAPYIEAAQKGELEKLSGLIDENESIFYEGWNKLPQAHPIIFDLMRRVQGIRLGRVIITRLAPGKEITPHADEGSPAEYYERYHVMLQNGPGSLFHCGDETVTMFPGDVWWFNNREVHSVVNNSADDRITMIVDIATA